MINGRTRLIFLPSNILWRRNKCANKISHPKVCSRPVDILYLQYSEQPLVHDEAISDFHHKMEYVGHPLREQPFKLRKYLYSIYSSPLSLFTVILRINRHYILSITFDYLPWVFISFCFTSSDYSVVNIVIAILRGLIGSSTVTLTII